MPKTGMADGVILDVLQGIKPVEVSAVVYCCGVNLAIASIGSPVFPQAVPGTMRITIIIKHANNILYISYFKEEKLKVCGE